MDVVQVNLEQPDMPVVVRTPKTAFIVHICVDNVAIRDKLSMALIRWCTALRTSPKCLVPRILHKRGNRLDIPSTKISRLAQSTQSHANEEW
jgi:hypothetical protein